MADEYPATGLSDRLLYCDVTQSWSAVGGGVGTYLRRKRSHILDRTSASHLMILPGARDETLVEHDGRAITVFIASPRVPGSPNYRLLLRNRAVRAALARYRPALVECQDAYNLPWAAIAHRKRNPETALVAAYMTDFPTTYVERPFSKRLGKIIGGAASRLSYRYCGALYRRFDGVFALSENGGAAKLRALGVKRVDVVPLGVELDGFSRARRDPSFRKKLGLTDHQPLLVYAGRLDGEKKPDVVVNAFRRLPAELGAALLLLGDGPYRERFAGLEGERIFAPGYCSDRDELARSLASADLYVSAMPDETFGVSIVEAQASGLPVVGVAAGAMVDRVTPETGRIGPVNDAAAMRDNIVELLGMDLGAMGRAARAEAERYSWDESMAALFGRFYRDALAIAAKRAGAPPLQTISPSAKD